MAISITTDEVKRKCGIQSADTSRDSDIEALIDEMQPAVEREINPVYLVDTDDTGLQAQIKLGILEIISGEFLEQMLRETGAGETVSVGGTSIGAPMRMGPDIAIQGRTRLTPYLICTADCAASNTVSVESFFKSAEENW